MSCRLLYLIGQLRSGGSERQVCFVVEGMQRKCYRPEVIVWNFREGDPYVHRIRSLDVPLHFFPRTSSRLVKLQALRRIVMQIQPEVLHSYTFYTNFAAWYATRGTKTVAIGAVQSDFQRVKRDTGFWLGRLSARWPHNQIFNSFAAAQAAQLSRGVFTPKQLSVVRNGLDLRRFHNLPLPTGGRVQIIGVGSLFRVKRWDRVVKAASALKRDGLDFRVRIVGDGPLREYLRQEVQAFGLADCVEFIPYCDDIPGLLGETTFLVHTSDSEGCPNVVMEAMACGRPVVATGVGDVPDLIEDGRTGFVVHPGDDEMLISRMTALITDPDLCRRMGAAGRVKAERAFGVDRLIAETLASYQAAGWKEF